jgi:chemotaxis protein histidine kinase CheA
MGMTSEGAVDPAVLQSQLRAVFASEAAGSLARVESLLERPPSADGREVVEALFREFHTMKVGAAAAGYGHAARALHDAESLLDAVRGAGGGLRGGDELHALRRVVERVRGEFGDAPPAGGDGVAVRALLPLLVRATATAAATEGKLVALDLAGGSVTLAGAVAGAVRGVLLHLVRNAVVHGIEAPADRQAAGKPRVGRVLVAALREPARLCLSVSDDGRGLDRAAIAAAARRAGLGGRAEELVLHAGLSTRAQADALAGRGVGLDAVACAIRELGGTVAVQSRDGLGCSVQLEIPGPETQATAAAPAEREEPLGSAATAVVGDPDGNACGRGARRARRKRRRDSDRVA